MWALSAMFFSRASRQIGSFVVTQIRLPFALVMLSVVAWVSIGSPWPKGLSTTSWVYLSASGFVGLTLGDITLFRSYLYLGPRRTSLVMSTTPIWAAVISFVLLKESITLRVVIGMFITIAGIWWALSARMQTKVELIGRTWVGVCLALLGALGQATGLVLAKKGMADISPIAATQVRLLAALVGGIVLVTLLRSWGPILKSLKDRRGLRFTMLGTIVGPVVGVTLSLYAIQHTNIALAACLMAMAPIMIIPLAMKFDGEKVGWTGFLGTLIAVAGVMVLLSA
jgi:drug/metabolite transporter (DMT)-like permease